MFVVRRFLFGTGCSSHDAHCILFVLLFYRFVILSGIFLNFQNKSFSHLLTTKLRQVFN